MVNVVFHTAFIGDLLLSIPFLRAIKARFPSRDLVLVTRPGLGDFFKFNQLADQVIELDKKSSVSTRAMREALGKFEIENLFCPHQSFRSAWILRNTKAKNKISYATKWNGVFFNLRVARDMTRPEALRLMDLLAVVDEKTKKQMETLRNQKLFLSLHPRDSVNNWPEEIPTDLEMTVPLPEGPFQALKKKLNLRTPYVLIAPSSQWKTKRWTLNGYLELAIHYLRQGTHVYVIGSPAERDYCVELVRGIETQQFASAAEIRSLAGETNFIELHTLMSKTQYVFANDSGPMHMASVAGVPAIGIFGPTTLELGYRPWSNLSRVAQVDLSCRPCGKHGHNECPIKTHDCMKKISARQVIELANSK